MGDGVQQLGEHLIGRRLGPEKPAAIGAIEVHTSQEQPVQVDVQVERTAEALDQGNCTGLGDFL